MNDSEGVIRQYGVTSRTDYLYRLSLKCVIRNDKGEVLVVKEAGRTTWDLPGGGMDHGEVIETAIAREMAEEVNLQGGFTQKVIAVEDPDYLRTLNIWQVRLIFELKPEQMSFSPGDDGDSVMFVDPSTLADSEADVERLVYEYSQV